jgi:hypothetical protein
MLISGGSHGELFGRKFLNRERTPEVCLFFSTYPIPIHIREKRYNDLPFSKVVIHSFVDITGKPLSALPLCCVKRGKLWITAYYLYKGKLRLGSFPKFTALIVVAFFLNK